jgi:TruB family pseudouridylate synthase (N terminal domain)
MFQSKSRIQRYYTKGNELKAIIIIVIIVMLVFMARYSSNAFTTHTIKLSHRKMWCPKIHRGVANQLSSKDYVRFRSSYRDRHEDTDDEYGQPLLVVEGLFAVDKPFEWTSQDVVSFIRGVFERDARLRGVKHGKVGSKKNRDKIIRCGHGGTLDPLATGVLVIGIGSGTKLLQRYVE